MQEFYVEIAKIHNVKLCVRSSFDTTKEGTFVVANELLEKEFVVTGLACDQKVAKIGIFDLDTTTVSKRTRDYLAKAEKAGIVENVCYDIPKSFIVCRDKNGNEKVYISQISSTTLLKRTGYVDSLTNV